MQSRALSFTMPKRLDRFAAVQADNRRELANKAAATKAARHAEQRARAQEMDLQRLARLSALFTIRLFLGTVPLSTHELRLPDQEAAKTWALGALSPYGPHLDPRALVNGEEVRPC